MPEFGERVLREVIWREYRIIYEALPDRIESIGIIHGLRLLTPPSDSG